jgi:predicted enzyme related to lactoylglutathione lyase
MSNRLIRVLVRVPNIERASAFYSHVLGCAGRRVSPGRHHFAVGSVELACYDPIADGDLHDIEQSLSLWQLYVAVDDLEAVMERVRNSGGSVVQPISSKPWGERSFYAADPFGNRICFVDATTEPIAG